MQRQIFLVCAGLDAGNIIKNHRCLHPIGTGGFGAGYKATNLQNGRKVALKVTLGQPTIVKEAEIMQELRHVR